MASINTGEARTTLTINKVSELKNLNSQIITLQNLPWQVMVFRSVKENTLGIRLTCLNTDTSDWSCAASASFELRSFKSSKFTLKGTILPWIFCANENSTSRTIIKWNDMLNNNDARYVQNDQINIDVKIIAKDLKQSNKTYLKTITNTNTAFKAYFFVHEANSLIAATSIEFSFCYLRWKIVVHGLGCRQTDGTKFGCMLWCVSKNAPLRWTRNIFATISFVGENDTLIRSSSEKKIEFTEKFTRKYFSDFILWSDVINPQNKIMRNGSIVLEIALKTSGNNTNQRNSRPPATQRSTPALDLPCAICFDSMAGQSARSIVTTICGHMFCRPCITTWIVERPNCPICDRILTVAQLQPVFLP